MKRPTDWERLLAFLSDYEWHSSAEITRALDVTVNSRAADLRHRGYTVVCRRVPGDGREAYQYRLLPQMSLFDAERAA